MEGMSRAAGSFLLEIVRGGKRELEASPVLISVREGKPRAHKARTIQLIICSSTLLPRKFYLIVLPYIFFRPHLQVNFNTLSIHPRAIYAYKASGDIPLPGYRRLRTRRVEPLSVRSISGRGTSYGSVAHLDR